MIRSEEMLLRRAYFLENWNCSGTIGGSQQPEHYRIQGGLDSIRFYIAKMAAAWIGERESNSQQLSTTADTTGWYNLGFNCYNRCSLNYGQG